MDSIANTLKSAAIQVAIAVRCLIGDFRESEHATTPYIHPDKIFPSQFKRVASDCAAVLNASSKKNVSGQTLTEAMGTFSSALLAKSAQDDFSSDYLEHAEKHIHALKEKGILPKLERDLASLGFRDEFEALGAGKDALVFGCRNYCVKIYPNNKAENVPLIANRHHVVHPTHVLQYPDLGGTYIEVCPKLNIPKTNSDELRKDLQEHAAQRRDAGDFFDNDYAA